MIRLLLIICIIAGLGASAAWLADHPGKVTIYWFDWRIDTSFAFLLMLIIAIVILFTCIYMILRAIFLAPSNFSKRQHLKHYEKGLKEITYSVAALAATDIKTAQKHTRKAEKLLGKTPLTLLLTAQVARNQGDEEKTRLLLTEMLEHKETEYLAARSLSEAANKQKQFSHALPLAQRANKINPKEKPSATSLIGLHIRLNAWQEALQAINKAARKGALLRSEKRYYLGIVYLQHGMVLLENNQAEAASANGIAALKYLRNFAPAINFSARAYIANSKPDKAISLILKHWKNTADPDIAATLRIAMAKQPMEKQLKTVRKLVAENKDNMESHLAVAETAIKFKEWEAARESLKIVLDKNESRRACKLMAYVEQGEFSDFDAAGRWLARSTDATQDPSWLCDSCNQTSEHWSAHCPRCDEFDTLHWHKATITVLD